MLLTLVACGWQARPEPYYGLQSRQEGIARTVKIYTACEGRGSWSTGSGVLLGPELVLTAHHVVQCNGATMYMVQHGDEILVAAHVSSVVESDLALLALPEALPFKSFRYGPKPAAGKKVCAYPARKDREPLCGTVRDTYDSATEDIGLLMGVMPGDSGAGIYTSDGRLVGIVVSGIFRRRGEPAIVGFGSSVLGRLD